MSEIRANSITDAAGTGAPNFPNGLEVVGAQNWTVSASGANLTFAYNGVNRMRLDGTTGNLTVTGNVTAFGTIT
jgi:hypothetical protein